MLPGWVAHLDLQEAPTLLSSGTMWGPSAWEVIISTQVRLLDPLPWLSLAPRTLPWPWNLWWLLPTWTGRGLRSPEPAHRPPSGPEPSCPPLLRPVLFDMPVSATETIWANPSVDLGLPRHKVCTWHELRVSFAGGARVVVFPTVHSGSHFGCMVFKASKGLFRGH